MYYRKLTVRYVNYVYEDNHYRRDRRIGGVRSLLRDCEETCTSVFIIFVLHVVQGRLYLRGLPTTLSPSLRCHLIGRDDQTSTEDPRRRGGSLSRPGSQPLTA
jgi:hypothetical protein